MSCRISYRKRAIRASFAIHAVITLAIAVFGGRMIQERRPVVIDFSIEDSAPAGNPAPVAEASPRLRMASREVAPQPVIPEPVRPEPVHGKIVTERAVEAAPIPDATSKPVEKVFAEVRRAEETRAVSTPASQPTPVQSAPELASPARNAPEMASPAASAVGGGSGTGSGESSRAAYIKHNFSNIKDMVQKRITYPVMARRMGWEGKVVVAFLVRADGGAENIRVVESAGYEALNKNTVEAVRQAVPFPKPPVEAEIILPIVYRLN